VSVTAVVVPELIELEAVAMVVVLAEIEPGVTVIAGSVVLTATPLMVAEIEVAVPETSPVKVLV
jgi:hypothetical protein